MKRVAGEKRERDVASRKLGRRDEEEEERKEESESDGNSED